MLRDAKSPRCPSGSGGFWRVAANQVCPLLLQGVLFLGTVKLGESIHKFLGVCNEGGSDGVDAVPGGLAGGAGGGFGL